MKKYLVLIWFVLFCFVFNIQAQRVIISPIIPSSGTGSGGNATNAQPPSTILTNLSVTGAITNIDTNGLFNSSGLLYNNGLLSGEYVMFDEFNKPNGTTKELGYANTKQKWGTTITYGGNAITNTWKFQDGRVIITNKYHDFGPTFWMSNAPMESWNLVGGMIRNSYPNGNTNGNQSIAFSFQTNAAFIGGQLAAAIDGYNIFIYENFAPIAQWTLPAFSYESNNIHKCEFIRTSNNLCFYYDGIPYVKRYTNQQSMNLAVVSWTLYGTVEAKSQQDLECVWAGYASADRISYIDKLQMTTTLIPTNSGSVSNLNIDFTVPSSEYFITNNITLTNFTGLAVGTNLNTILFITPQLIPRGIGYPTLGGPGYKTYWYTNQNSPLWTSLTNGITYALSLSSRGTNVHASLTEWK